MANKEFNPKLGISPDNALPSPDGKALWDGKQWVSVKKSHDFEFAGHKFTFIDPNDSSYLMLKRNDFFLMEYEREWGLIKEDLIKLLTRSVNECEFSEDIDVNLAKALNKLQDVKTILTMMVFLIQQDYQYKPFLKSAAIVILIDDEKPEDDYMDTLNLKLELCEKHSEIEGFFLGTIKILHDKLMRRTDTTKTSESSIQNPQVKHTEKALLSMIRSSPYQNG